MTDKYDLVILDVTAPNRDSWSILHQLRRSGKQVPDCAGCPRRPVKALEGRANSYLIKPFAHPELMARVRSLLRRGPRPPTQRAPDQRLGDDFRQPESCAPASCLILRPRSSPCSHSWRTQEVPCLQFGRDLPHLGSSPGCKSTPTRKWPCNSFLTQLSRATLCISLRYRN